MAFSRVGKVDVSTDANRRCQAIFLSDCLFRFDSVESPFVDFRR